MARVPLVLHVDDSRMMLMGVKEIVSYELKLNLLQASDGPECIKIAKENKPDIIFIDAIMSPMDGWQTARELKANSKTKDIPLIMVTGADKEEDIELAYSVGFADYIVKPPTKEKMLRKMVKVLGEDLFKDAGIDLSCVGGGASAAPAASAPQAAAPAADKPSPCYCSACKKYLTWVPNQGWYCYACQKYEDPQPPAPAVKKMCSCGAEMSYLHEQNMWYCFACQKQG